MSRLFAFALIYIASIFSSYYSFSADTLFVKDKDIRGYELSAGYLEIFEDTSNRIGLVDILSNENRIAFKLHTDKKSFAFIKNPRSTYWVKFKIQGGPEAVNHYVIENSDLHIGEFTLYSPAPNGTYTKETAGFSLPFNVRKYPHKNFIFDLSLDSTAKTYYVKVKSEHKNPFIFKVKSTANFSFYALNEYYMLGIFYGIVIIMALYNFLMYFSLREKVYIHYVVYVICCGLISFGEDGLGFQYLWPDKPFLNDYISLAAPLLLMVSFSVYAKSFLELKRVLPKANTILNVMIALYVFAFVLNVLGVNLHLNFPLYIFPFTIIYISSFICFKKGLRQARFFIAGYSFMFMSILFLVLRMSGIIRWDDLFTVYSFNIGIVFEIMILSFALRDRIRIIKAENDKAQLKIIEQLKINEKLKDDINLELEIKVKERTAELNEKNQELESAYDEINRMNKLLDADNKELKTNVNELTKARVLMKEVDFAEFSEIFPDKESCFKYLEELKWANGYQCKKCGNEKWCKGKDEFAKRCTKCRYDESSTAYTIFHKLKFPITKAFYMLFLVYANKEKITSLELSEILDLRQSTCWNFNKKINDMLIKNKKKTFDQDIDGWAQLILDPDNV
jgi:two-component system, sensor histidine kinase LadS